MIFEEFMWENRSVETPNRIRLKNVSDGSELGIFDVIKEEGEIYDKGTKLDENNMNYLESRIFNMFDEGFLDLSLNNLEGDPPIYNDMLLSKANYYRVGTLLFISFNLEYRIESNNGTGAILTGLNPLYIPKLNNSGITRYGLSKAKFNVCGITDGLAVIENDTEKSYIALYNNDLSSRLDWDENNPNVSISANGIYQIEDFNQFENEEEQIEDIG